MNQKIEYEDLPIVFASDGVCNAEEIDTAVFADIVLQRCAADKKERYPKGDNHENV